MVKHASLPRARATCYAGLVRLTHFRKYCTGGKPLSFGARPWCDVRAVASNTQLAFAWHALARCVGCLLGGVKTRELAALARRVTLAVVGLRTLEGTALQDGLSLLAWGDVRAVTSNTQPAFAWHARKPHCAGCVSGGSELREVATRSRLAALFVVVLRTLFWHCTNEKPLSFGARPWFDVRAVTSNTWII